MPDLPEGEIVSARVVKTPLRVTVQFIVAVEDRPRAPDMPMGMDMGLKERATLSTGEMIPAVYLDRRALKRKQRALARAKRGRRKKLKALQRAYERVRVSERNAFHRISTAIVKRHNRIAVEDLQIG
ncbi:MAG: transposase, partial [Rhodospirillaceae bacterium]|nr:transposase [Rhodospirillaceae bacterium]